MDFEGVNHFQQRFAFGGNQFSGEPPDQGLCVGGGYILETVNSALRVYNKANGAPLTAVLALNEFYGFPPAINRTTGVFGPFTFDISCHYDPDSGRWFHLAVDLDQDPATGAFTGRNYLDLAVSDSGDPTGSWTVYRIPAINDGSEGTPDHDCAGGPCFGDFPHLGVDKNGVYITTNEFPLFADGFIGAQVYAISKAAATSGAMSVPVFLFNTADDPVGPDQPGFTLWPSLSPGTQFAGRQGVLRQLERRVRRRERRLGRADPLDARRHVVAVERVAEPLADEGDPRRRSLHGAGASRAEERDRASARVLERHERCVGGRVQLRCSGSYGLASGRACPSARSTRAIHGCSTSGTPTARSGPCSAPASRSAARR